MWEYKRIAIEFEYLNQLNEELQRLGEDSWEIVYYDETKPPKFGDKWISTVLIKRLKPAYDKHKNSNFSQ